MNKWTYLTVATTAATFMQKQNGGGRGLDRQIQMAAQVVTVALIVSSLTTQL